MKFGKDLQAKLYQDLKDADVAAKAAYAECMKNGGDGGTCNFDSAVMWFPRVQKEKVEKVAASASCSLYKFSNGGYHLSVPCGAQGFARTVQAEAQRKLLEERGWEVTMYYAMD